MGLFNLLFDSNPEPKPAQQQPRQPQQPQPAFQNCTVTVCPPPESFMGYFREIIRREFPEYTLRENVAVTELVGNAADSMQLYSTRPYQAYRAEWGQPYSFVMYKNGIVKGVVMLGNNRSHESNVKFLISRKYAQKVGVPYINFYTQFHNRKSYVVERIRDFLYNRR